MIGASRLLRGSVINSSRPCAIDAASGAAAARTSPSWVAARLAVCRGSGTRTALAQGPGSRLLGASRRCSGIPRAHHHGAARSSRGAGPSSGLACARRARGQQVRAGSSAAARGGALGHGMRDVRRRGAWSAPRHRAVRVMSSAQDGSADAANGAAREEAESGATDAGHTAGAGARRRSATGIGGPLGLHARHTPTRSLSLSSAHLQDADLHGSAGSGGAVRADTQPLARDPTLSGVASSDASWLEEPLGSLDDAGGDSPAFLDTFLSDVLQSKEPAVAETTAAESNSIDRLLGLDSFVHEKAAAPAAASSGGQQGQQQREASRQGGGGGGKAAGGTHASRDGEARRRARREASSSRLDFTRFDGAPRRPRASQPSQPQAGAQASAAGRHGRRRGAGGAVVQPAPWWGTDVGEVGAGEFPVKRWGLVEGAQGRHSPGDAPRSASAFMLDELDEDEDGGAWWGARTTDEGGVFADDDMLSAEHTAEQRRLRLRASRTPYPASANRDASLVGEAAPYGGVGAGVDTGVNQQRGPQLSDAWSLPQKVSGVA